MSKIIQKNPNINKYTVNLPGSLPPPLSYIVGIPFL
jgi:hypothetical protein